MHAAVVRSFVSPPAFEPFDAPTPTGPDEMLIEVLAAGLHPRTRSSANGSHYTSTGQLPMIPGFDGIGRDRDGQGSVSTNDIIGELPALAAEISTGTYTIDAVATPLAQVESAWNAPLAPGQRIVFVPTRT
jgi:NADPH:quinone reductase-like Zn-dependent oxidoreductase